MREDSLFRIASAGKPITAAAVLTLIADGHLQIDDPIGEMLPHPTEQTQPRAWSPSPAAIRAGRPAHHAPVAS
jgi:CubicO group peptidase (beta-lactamase class C family)